MELQISETLSGGMNKKTPGRNMPGVLRPGKISLRSGLYQDKNVRRSNVRFWGNLHQRDLRFQASFPSYSGDRSSTCLYRTANGPRRFQKWRDGYVRWRKDLLRNPHALRILFDHFNRCGETVGTSPRMSENEPHFRIFFQVTLKTFRCGMFLDRIVVRYAPAVRHDRLSVFWQI